MHLTILQVGYPLARVGPDVSGGAEQVLSMIDEAVVRAGHRSIVIAPEQSVTAGELVAVPAPPDVLDDAARARAHDAHRRAIAAVLSREDVDLVHLHGLDFPAYLPDGPRPRIATLHLPPDWYPASVFQNADVWLHPVSETQRRSCPPCDRLLPTIPNGVRLDRFDPTLPTGDDLVCLGRICPEKGFDVALDAARLAGAPLVIAGQLYAYPEHTAYFAREIAPRLSAEHRWIGPVGAAARRELLGRARGLLIASRCAETSSLVAMEALASGTPVIATRAGALPEIVEDGVTGFLVDDVREMADAIGRLDTIDRAVCRRVAEARFGADTMTSRYLALYARLVGGRRRPPPTAPSSTARAPTFEVLDGDGFAAVADEWRSLADGAATLFQSPDWLVPWADVFAGDRAAAVTWRRGGRLVGVLPLLREGGAYKLLGVGNTDHLGGVFAEEPDLRAVMDALGADRLELDDLPEGSPLLRAPAVGLADERAPSVPCPLVRLDEPLPKRIVANARYAARRSAREHAREIRALEDPDDAIDRLIALHGSRWSARDQEGVLADPHVQRFHREVARRFAARRLLRAWALHLDGAPVAVWYGFRDRDRLVYYLGGFDPRWERSSPGQQLMAHALASARAEGCVAVDLLRGSEPYKYAWGAVDQPQWRRVLTRG